MAMRGTPLIEQWDRDYIIESFYECRGKVVDIASKLHCYTAAVYSMISEDLDLKAELQQARDVQFEDRQDASETVLEKLLTVAEENPMAAFKSASYILSKHGKARGWGEDNTDVAEDVQAVRELLESKLGPPDLPKDK